MAVRRKPLVVMAVAILAVAGLGVVGATIDTTYTSSLPGAGDGSTGGSGGDLNGGGGVGDSDDPDSGGEINNGGERTPLEIPEICVEFLTTIPGILLLVVGILLAVGIGYRQSGFVGGAFVGYLLGLPAVIGYGLVTQCGGQPTGSGGSESPLQTVISQLPVEGSLVSTPVPPALLIGVFALAAIAAVVGLVSASGSEEIEPPTEDDEELETDLEEFAAAAGEAADRIESKDASVDNAVYRAWQEMTELLDIPNPEASTAGMFADAAVEAGMNEADVGRLTRLFEEVRYGDMDPEPREELALETLRGIEEQYGASDGTDEPANDEPVNGDGGDGS